MVREEVSAYCIISLTTIFFFNDTATTEIYTLSLHDALPICLSFYAFKRWSGSIEYLFIYNNTLYQLDALTNTTQVLKENLTTDSKMGFVSFNDYCYCGNSFQDNYVIRPVFVHKTDSGNIISTADAVAYASAYTLLNDIKIKYNSHIASTVAHNADEDRKSVV